MTVTKYRQVTSPQRKLTDTQSETDTDREKTEQSERSEQSESSNSSRSEATNTTRGAVDSSRSEVNNYNLNDEIFRYFYL